MPIDAARLQDFATSYTAALCSQNAASVAAHYADHGSLAINGGRPAVGRAAITHVAQSFMTAFPDLRISMDGLHLHGEQAEYQWILIGPTTVREAPDNRSGSPALMSDKSMQTDLSHRPQAHSTMPHTSVRSSSAIRSHEDDDAAVDCATKEKGHASQRALMHRSRASA
jgi:hypothetical protein